MLRLLQSSFVLLGLLLAVNATPENGKRATCTTKVAHKPWGMLTTAERSAYLNAELCLMAAPSKSGVAGAVTRWDDLQWNHIISTGFVHDVGQFLPWHRYYVAVHGRLLRDECGYTGPIPYWDETADASLSNLESSELFKADAFGGNGSGSNRYITTGPFANTTLRLKRPGQTPAAYKISRNLNVGSLQAASESSLNSCFNIDTYVSAWECWHGSPHGSGHGATGGLMLDPVMSPGDPVFYLHHGWLDVMWWKWQTLDLPRRLTDIGGRNLPRESWIRSANLTYPGPEWYNYDGEDGNSTTLAHILSVGGLYPNVTVGDVMDVGGAEICAEYIFSKSFEVTRNVFVDGVLATVTE